MADTTITQNEVKEVTQNEAREAQPIQPSRAQFDFPKDQNVTDTTNETEKKLLELNTDETAGEQTPSEQEVSEASSEQPTGSSENLPTMAELDLPEDLGLKPDGKTEDGKEVAPPDEDFKKFAESFEKYMGVPLNDFQSQFKQTQEYVNQVKAQQAQIEATKLLTKEWGIDSTEVQARLDKVQDRFSKYPKEMQDRLDSLEGAKLIWAKIEQEEANRLNKDVPQFQKSRGRVSSSPKPMFTQAEIDAMPQEVYARNADRILRAYQMGLVQQ